MQNPSIGVPSPLPLKLLCGKVKLGISEKVILAKINERNKARNNKNYKLADKIRKELLDKGISIEDTNGKTTWKFK